MANEIILTFDYETPPSAEDLGEVFRALGRDYRDMSGGVLAVTRVQRGSIIVALTDAVLAAAPYVKETFDALGVVNTINEFAENLKKWFGRSKTNEGKKRLYKKGKKTPGQRSVEAIILIAAKTRSHVKVKHTAANGETLEAEITPSEAIEIHKAATSRIKVTELPIATTPTLAVRPEVEVAVERLRHAGSQNLSFSQIEAVVEIIVSALQMSGATHALPEIASRLEMHGLYEFAQAVRKHIRGRGALEPPQRTT